MVFAQSVLSYHVRLSRQLRSMHLPRSWQSSASLSPWLHSRCSLISLAFGIWADSNLRQEFCVNSLLNGFNVEAIIPTGSGKTLIVYLYALALRQLFPESKSLVLVGLCSIVFLSSGQIMSHAVCDGRCKLNIKHFQLFLYQLINLISFLIQ